MKLKRTIVPTTVLSLLLSGCGYDVEITSHRDVPDFSDHHAFILEPSKVKGTYLDPDYRQEVANTVSAINSKVRDKGLAESETALTDIDAYIEELDAIEGVDVSVLKSQLSQLKVNVQQVRQVDAKRSELARTLITEKATPIFAEIDASLAKKTEFEAFIKAERDRLIVLEEQEKTVKAAIDKINNETNAQIDSYIIENELPLKVSSHGHRVTFQNVRGYRAGHTCMPKYKDKADFRGTLLVASTGEKICAKRFYYSVSSVSFSEADGMNVDAIAKKGLQRNFDNYVKLGHAWNQIAETETALKNKTIIAENKYATSQSQLESDLWHAQKKIDKLGDELFNEDRTINEASRSFNRYKTSRKMRSEVPDVRLNNGLLDNFYKFDERNDDAYVMASMKAFDAVAHKVKMGSNGFDLPSGVEEKDVHLLLVVPNKGAELRDIFIWERSAFSGEGRVAMDSRSFQGAQDVQSLKKRIASSFYL